jgi:hypothetical protein
MNATDVLVFAVPAVITALIVLYSWLSGRSTPGMD